jgi:GT2 family glycosyltransferase
MITIIYSTHKDTNYNNKFKQHLLQSVELKDVQILEYQNNNKFSLSQIYNKGVSESKYNIIVCCHNDIKLEKGWGKKLLKDFEENLDFGIIGMAGSCYFPESGVYWDKMNQTMVGQVYHHPPNQKKWLSTYSSKFPFIIPVVTIDGLFISFNKQKIKHLFDESYGKFHFYDHGFCVPNYLDNVKIGVTTSFSITHESIGKPNDEFFQSKDKFLEKWGDKLPLDLKPEKIYIPQIKEKPIRNIGKVAVIIPTKGKLNLLFPCIESFYEHCNENLFEIFVADTGSSEDEKIEIRNFISSKPNIKLIEYDYYNFAKINNDVVKNHLKDNHEFILFCNNDIKVCNNVIYGMLKTFKEDKKIGTVGARLHFKDNTIQHGGIIMVINEKNVLGVTHNNLGAYYGNSNLKKSMIGSTGALLMVRKKVFEQVGYFNENYINCFEDVELNLSTILLGYNNVYDGNLVAYHYESSTRGEDSENIKKLMLDYNNNLLPFIVKNYNSLSDKIYKVN